MFQAALGNFMSQSSSKWTFWNAILFLCGVIVLIGMSTFLAITLLQHFRDPTQLWLAATNLFTLFGVLLATGVAFALLTVAISYVSLNGKLQQAQAYLAQARLHLDEYTQLSRQERMIEENVYQLAKAYDAFSAHPHVSEVEYVQSLIKQILSSEFADFEARLMARAVQQDWQAKQLFNIAKSQSNEQLWQQTISQLQQAALLWQTVLTAAPEFLQINQQKHFFAAKLNQSIALQNLAMIDGTSQQAEYYQELQSLYQPLLAAEKSKDNELNQMFNFAAYQSGVQTYQEGEWLWQQNSKNLADVRKKWYQAQQYFQKALEMQPNDAESAYQWGVLLEREARLVAQTDASQLAEAKRLWLAAREKYRIALDIDGNRADAAFNWGNSLSDEATALVQTDATQLSEARILWQSAREKFTQALDINAHFDAAAHHSGMTLMKEADAGLRINQNINDARSLWKQAGESFQMALDINKLRFETANLWGLVLAKEADLLVKLGDDHVDEALHLWQLAQQRFHRALEIEPNLQAAASNWRTVLSHESNLLDVDAQRDLWQAAHDKIESLQQVSPEHTQSEAISHLAMFVQQEQEKLPSNAALEPPAFRPITRNDQSS